MDQLQRPGQLRRRLDKLHPYTALSPVWRPRLLLPEQTGKTLLRVPRAPEPRQRAPGCLYCNFARCLAWQTPCGPGDSSFIKRLALCVRQVSAIYEIAISPDCFEDWPIPLNQMVSWAFEPADEETLRFYIAKGRADAKVRR